MAVKGRTELWYGQPLPGVGAVIPSQCPTCMAPVGSLPFCPHDGTVFSRLFCVGERYLVEESLGAGGMALVFGARHQVLGKPVAIKVLRPELAADADQARRFLREARSASQLDHENIVAVLDFGRDEQLDLNYLVMERLYGQTLAQLMEAEGPLPWRRALPMLAQLCRALNAAHQAGLVHRDLTPRNVIVTLLSQSLEQRERLKLCDFGLSRLADGNDRITATGVLIGTPAYMAPEQLRGDEVQDHRVDLYALGVLAHELLTGELPVEAPTPVALIAAKLNEDVRSLRERFPERDIPQVLDDLVLRCLARDPAQRPVNAAELEQALLAVGEVSAALAAKGSLVGQSIGSYRVVELLGSGGVGSVYLAEHPVIGTKVAIKVLLPEISAAKEVVDRFVQEARAATDIGSPRIPRYQDFGRLPDGRPYAIMEYLQGETLEQRLQRRGALPLAECATILEQCAEALVAAHAAGIVHRDIKPANLFLEQRDDGGVSVKVLDFGIAKMLAPDRSSTKTQFGMFVGTPLYCSPEQAYGQEVTPASDIYALGVTAFEMIIGTPPFSGTVSDILGAKTSQRVPALRALRPALPEEVERSVAAMVERDPRRRTASMQQVLEQLRAWPRQGVASDADVATTAKIELSASGWGDQGHALARAAVAWLRAAWLRLPAPWPARFGAAAAVLALLGLLLWAVAGSGEQPRAGAAATEAPKIEAAKTEAAKTEAAKTELPKVETVKTETVKTETVKTELPKTEAAKTELPKVEAVKTETAKSETVKTETAKNVAKPRPAAERGKKRAPKGKSPTSDVVIVDPLEE